MVGDHLNAEGMAIIVGAYRELGTLLSTLSENDRRRIVAAIVQAVGEQCPVAVADMAACANFRILLGGVK